MNGDGPSAFEWARCERRGHDEMWARTPGVPDRAVHVCGTEAWIPLLPCTHSTEDDE